MRVAGGFGGAVAPEANLPVIEWIMSLVDKSISVDSVRLLESKLSRNFVILLLLASAGTAVQVAECYWLWAQAGESDAVCEVLKLVSTFLTLWLIFFLFLYYRRKFEQRTGHHAQSHAEGAGSNGACAP